MEEDTRMTTLATGYTSRVVFLPLNFLRISHFLLHLRTDELLRRSEFQ